MLFSWEVGSGEGHLQVLFHRHFRSEHSVIAPRPTALKIFLFLLGSLLDGFFIFHPKLTSSICRRSRLAMDAPDPMPIATTSMTTNSLTQQVNLLGLL